MALLPLLALTGIAAIGVRGQSICPTVAEVYDRLEGLTRGDGPLSWAELQQTDRGVELFLWSPERRLLASRELVISGSCEELAQASAVVIATWASNAEPAVVQTVDFVRRERVPVVLDALPPEQVDDGITRKLQPSLAAGIRTVVPMLAPSVSLGLGYLADDALGLALELSVGGPVVAFTPELKQALGQRPVWGAGLAAGPLYRRGSATVTADFFALAELAVLISEGELVPSFEAKTGVRLLFGAWKVAPFVRFSGGFMLSAWGGAILPSFSLDLGFTWSRT